jgi:hypothetical protein
MVYARCSVFASRDDPDGCVLHPDRRVDRTATGVPKQRRGGFKRRAPRLGDLRWSRPAIERGVAIYGIYRWIVGLQIGEAERTLLAAGLTLLLWMVVTRV